MNLTPIRMSEENQDANNPEASSASEEETLETTTEASPNGEEEEEEVVEGEEGVDFSEDGMEESVPFHKHPRWQAREERLKELESKLALMEKESENARRLAAMTPEERQAFESAKKLNLVTKFDLDDVHERHNAETKRLREEIAIKDFLVKFPSARGNEQAVRELATLANNAGKSYENIYKEYFGATRKVIKRTVRTGVRPTGSVSTKSAGTGLTAEEIKAMSLADYTANRTEIMQLMRKGKLL